jgi:hypothetical protein
VTSDNGRNAERRLVERHDAPRITISWRVGERRHLFGRTASIEAHLVNVSTTGAGILAPAAADLVVRSRVAIEWNGARATVEIRHVEPGPIPGVNMYGVAFGVRDAAFDQQLDGHISAMRPTSVEALRVAED